MKNKLKLGIIYGGRSGEHEVSLMSARSVLSVIDRRKFDVIEIGISRQGQWFIGNDLMKKLEDENFDQLTPAIFLPTPQNPGIYARENDRILLHSHLDVLFPVMHGTYSEDGTLQGLFELADIAYVGSGVLGSAACMDKGLFKDIMIANDIPVLAYKIFNRHMIEHEMESCLNSAETIGDYPLFTKPANLGSSVGISKCNNRNDLMKGLRFAAQYDRRIVIEKGINKAREIEVSILGNEYPSASIPGEIVPKDIFYTYEEKYINETAELLIPANISKETITQVQLMALRAYKATDCAGMARVDFLIDPETEAIFLNEINTIPGFTKISMYPKLWEASDLPYPELVEKLIDLALERKSQRDKTEREFRS
jgi:D-alanine-D-alanine ligase